MQPRRTLAYVSSTATSLIFALSALWATPPPLSGGAHLFIPNQPGLTVEDFCFSPAAGHNYCDYHGVLMRIDFPRDTPLSDAAGNIYPAELRYRIAGTCPIAGGQEVTLNEHLVERVTLSGTTEIVGVFRDHCEAGIVTRVVLTPSMVLDPFSGHLLVSLGLFAYDGPTPYAERAQVVRITGLPTLADVFLSYQPPSTLSFNVPVRPEGLAGADSFSLFAGDAGSVSDLSQAVALQCAVPAGRPPLPGEQLTVADTLPNPAAGDGRYYLAAVNYQDERRAGRDSRAGHPQGRNARALPQCN